MPHTNNIVVNAEKDSVLENSKDEFSELSSWVMSRVDGWREYRDANFKDKWQEYYRLWRGIWASQDKQRQSERSKLISPALQQAIEAAVSELEEAIFGRGKWFDVKDDWFDRENQEMEQILTEMKQFRVNLDEDLDFANVKDAVSEIFLNGSIYGTGIGKIIVEEVEEEVVVPSEFGEPVTEGVPRVNVSLVPVEPLEFVIDSSAKNIDDALGMAHETIVPKHSVLSKQQNGVYFDVDVGSFQDDLDVSAKGEQKDTRTEDQVKLTEYHGLVPSAFIDPEVGEGEELVDLGVDSSLDESEVDLVEAIVTIANDSVVLRAVENPFLKRDRSFIAYQHDTVPNRFWGRGVAEKGYNPQKALDSELRARMDAMALVVHPMMAMDATRMPRGGDFTVRPGKTLLTNGDPRTVLMPMNYGNLNPATFGQSSDLERMIQMGTGSFDSAAPTTINARNATATGASLVQGAAIKRSKRTIANIERNFISPLIHKSAWRYMQFDPERYPARDIKFKVLGTLGIMAREFETQQLTNLLNTVPPDSPAFWLLIRGIFENSSVNDKEQVLMFVQQFLQQAMNPQPPQPGPAEQIAAQKLQLEAQLGQARLQIEAQRAATEQARVQIEAARLPASNAKTQTDALLNIAKARSEESATSISELEAALKSLDPLGETSDPRAGEALQ